MIAVTTMIANPYVPSQDLNFIIKVTSGQTMYSFQIPVLSAVIGSLNSVQPAMKTATTTSNERNINFFFTCFPPNNHKVISQLFSQFIMMTLNVLLLLVFKYFGNSQDMLQIFFGRMEIERGCLISCDDNIVEILSNLIFHF